MAALVDVDAVPVGSPANAVASLNHAGQPAYEVDTPQNSGSENEIVGSPASSLTSAPTSPSPASTLSASWRSVSPSALPADGVTSESPVTPTNTAELQATSSTNGQEVNHPSDDVSSAVATAQQESDSTASDYLVAVDPLFCKCII